MKLRGKYCTSFFGLGLLIGTAFAQQTTSPPPPAPGLQITRVRRAYSAGMCGGGYCYSETAIGPRSIRFVSASSSDKKQFPDETITRAIAKKDWDDLQHFIDAEVLAAFTGRVGCPACSDRPEHWVQLEFSDGTTKSVSYDPSNPPVPIAALLRKMEMITAKSQHQPKVR